MTKTHYTGTFEEGCPGHTGVVKCKCEIYANKPIFKRRQQDQDFIISPETLSNLPDEIRKNLNSINGSDGIFLREIHNYRSNYLAFKKKIRTNSTDVNNGLTKKEKSARNAVSIWDLLFLPNPGVNPADNKAPIRINQPVEEKESPHQTWIIDGSLFCSDTQNYSEYFKCRKDFEGHVDMFGEFKRQYLSAWRYDFFNSPPTISVVDGTSTSGSSTKFRPYQFVNSKESPAVFLARAGFEGLVPFHKAGNVYRDVNPGIHWSAIKRTDVFQGQDFWVEFICGTKESNIPEHGNAIFSMQPKYKFLDVHAKIFDGIVVNGGVVELDEHRSVTEESKELYDLARQSYFMIEIGVEHPDHNYFILIPEKDYPIFIHAGQFLTFVPRSDDPPDISNSEDEKGGDCANEFGTTENQKPTGDIPVRPSEKISRKLSSWKVASGKTLMERQEGIRVTVRNHLGSLIITFSGYEDRPWVIHRNDLVGGDTKSVNKDLSVEDLSSQSIPMIVPHGKIALYGGNRQCSFSFSPLQYYNNSPFKMPQPLSVLGPVEQEDINLLLRDKGLSVNPSRSSSSSSDYEFSMDAEVFYEMVNGKISKSHAIYIQPGVVKLFGKAPDAQRIRDNKRAQSSIKIDNARCLRKVGSTGPYVTSTEVFLSIKPGDYIFDSPDYNDVSWHLPSCITPIVTGYKLFVPPEGVAYNANAVDVSHHVMQFSDSWSARDFSLIEHTGRIQFLINDGMEFLDQTNFAPFLASLTDKTFYIQVSIWWEGGVMPTPILDNDKIIITGTCPGGSITIENGKKIMSCDIFDYYNILKDQKFMNSPFFDKMRDFNAVYEILKMAGFRDVRGSDPASLMKRLAQSSESGWFEIIHNGDPILVNDYSLPGSYDIITQPFMRFADGETYADAINRMASISGKVTYFDRLGVFHFENLPFEQLFFNAEGVDSQTPVEDYYNLSKIDFFVSPRDLESSDFHRQVFNSYTIKRNVEDVVNEIRVISATPNGELLVAGHTNFDSLFRHDTPGFIGYPKQFMQMDGIFGSEDAVKYIVKHYTKMFVPPVTFTFEANGHNKLKALDVITFQKLYSKEKQPLIIQSINSEVDPSKNSWIQKFECEWIYPSTDINWGPGSERNINHETI